MSVRRTLFLDDFSSDGALGDPNYTSMAGWPVPIASGGECTSTVKDWSGAHYTGALPADQWVQFRYSDIPTDDKDTLSYGVGITIRSNASISTGYAFYASGDQYEVLELPAQTELYKVYRTQVPDDVFRVEVEGDTLKLFVNDVEDWSTTGLNSAGGGCGLYFTKGTDGDRTSGKIDDFEVGDWTVETGFSVTNINGDNTIESGQKIYIAGDKLDTVTGVTLKGYGDHALTIESQSISQITCTAVDLMAWNYPFGGGASIEVTDGPNPVTTPVTVEVAASYQYVVGASVDATYGLAQAGGGDGDQWHTMMTLASSSLELRDDTNFVLDAPVPEGTVLDFDLYSSSIWDTGDAVINQNIEGELPPLPAAWTNNLFAEQVTVGVDFSGSVAQAAEGDAPLSFAEVLQEKPSEFVFRSDGTYSGYVPTSDTFNVQYRVSNASNQSGDLSNLLTYEPIMPTLVDAKHQNVDTDGAQITLTTPSRVGTVYWIADPEQTEPTGEQIAAGVNGLDQGAEMSGSFPISQAGQQPWQYLNGGKPGVTYYYWMVQVN